MIIIKYIVKRKNTRRNHHTVCVSSTTVVLANVIKMLSQPGAKNTPRLRLQFLTLWRSCAQRAHSGGVVDSPTGRLMGGGQGSTSSGLGNCALNERSQRIEGVS